MKELKDNFSSQSKIYKKFRPRYPQVIYDYILTNGSGRQNCWDNGTGNGQVAIELSKYFEQVQATDISTKQLEQAEKKANIHYVISRSEQSNFEENTFDIITVAQAIHWFDFDQFYKEVQRVGKPDSCLFVWGYGLLKINPKVDAIIDEFYTQIIGSYWDEERKHIDQAYESINFPFEGIPALENASIDLEWNLDQLLGYLNSWSSVQKYIRANHQNPVDLIKECLAKAWGKEETLEMKFPLFMKSGIIRK